MNQPQALHFSPSAYHQHLMAQMTPALRYTTGDVAAWQAELRPQLRQLVGDPFGDVPSGIPASATPLNVRTLWSRTHELGRIDKIVYTAEPFCDVPAYLCLPANAAPPYPMMICLQGHSTGMHNSIAVQFEDETLPHQVAGDRDFALHAMRHGFAALCIEQRSFGERREQQQEKVSAHGCHDATMQALLLGRTLIGERVYDVARGIDYLATRDDIDMARIGVMGNSGGGTIALFAAALLPQIAFAMPSCYFCTFQDSIMSLYHCADNYIPGLFKVAEMADVMGLFAPKPVVIVAGKEDPIFPIEATRRAFGDLQKIYAASGAADRCRLVEGHGGHRFYADDAWPVLLEVIGRRE